MWVYRTLSTLHELLLWILESALNGMSYVRITAALEVSTFMANSHKFELWFTTR